MTCEFIENRGKSDLAMKYCSIYNWVCPFDGSPTFCGTISALKKHKGRYDEIHPNLIHLEVIGSGNTPSGLVSQKDTPTPALIPSSDSNLERRLE